MDKETKEIIKLLEGKLRLPIHINYIASHIIRKPIDETRELIKKFVEDGIIEESKHGKEYYRLKSNE